MPPRKKEVPAKKSTVKPKVKYPFPRATLEKALKIPYAIKELNGGNPWERDIIYAPNPEVELALKKQAFLNIDIFKKVLEYYKGSNLPDMKYLGNTLTKEFDLHPETHDEFAQTFRENCQYLGIISGLPAMTDGNGGESQIES